MCGCGVGFCGLTLYVYVCIGMQIRQTYGLTHAPTTATDKYNQKTGKTKFIFILTQFAYTLLTCLPAFAVYGCVNDACMVFRR